MEFVWRVGLAFLGLLLVRGFVHPRGWGHRTLIHLFVAVVGASLAFPLLSYGRGGLIVGLITAVVTLLPYRAIAATFLRSRARKGMKQMAAGWRVRLGEAKGTGLWTVSQERDGVRRWAGNVLSHMRSIHPGVRKSEVGYMLAFVFELPVSPPFICSLMYGWKKPRYFEREWRSTYVMQGNHFAMSLSDLLEGSDKGRETGGRTDELGEFAALRGAREDLVILGKGQEEFLRCFSGQRLAEFHLISTQTFPFELNITPTSISIYTTYCDAAAQRADVDFLEKLSTDLSARLPGGVTVKR